MKNIQDLLSMYDTKKITRDYVTAPEFEPQTIAPIPAPASAPELDPDPAPVKELEQFEMPAPAPEPDMFQRYEQILKSRKSGPSAEQEAEYQRLTKQREEELTRAERRDTINSLIDSLTNYGIGTAKAQGQYAAAKPIDVSGIQQVGGSPSAVDTTSKKYRTLIDEYMAKRKLARDEQRDEEDRALKIAALSAKPKDAPMTPGEKKLEEQLVKEEIAPFLGAQGAKADNKLDMFRGFIDEMDTIAPDFGIVSGSLASAIPGSKLNLFRDKVNNYFMRDLKPILGAQFTENEAKRFLDSVFNPRGTLEDNKKRMLSQFADIKAEIGRKQSMANYFKANNYSIKGFDEDLAYDKAGKVVGRKDDESITKQLFKEYQLDEKSKTQPKQVQRVLKKGNTLRTIYTDGSFEDKEVK